MSEQIQFPYKDAMDVADIVCESLKPHVEDMIICGGLRRKKQWVHDIDIVIKIADETAIFWLNSVLGSSFVDYKSTDKKIELTLQCNFNRIKVEITPCITEQQFEVMKLIRTGSAEFNRQLVTRAHEKKMAIRFSGENFGLFGAYQKEGEWLINPQRVEGRNEKDIIMKVFDNVKLLDPENRDWKEGEFYGRQEE